jgi:DNA-binding LacI/PurR family transcriptional regulator
MSADGRRTRHKEVKDLLIRRLQDRSLGDRLPSDRALAKECGVAFLTISRVMRELEWEGYVERRPRKGTFLASRERAVQTDMRTGTREGDVLIFAYPDYYSFTYWLRLHIAGELAVKNGLGLIEFRMNPETTYGGLCELVARTDNARGLLLVPVPDSVDRRSLTMLDGLGLPVVLLGACDFVSLGTRTWSVTADWYKSGYLMAKALIDRGHRRIAYVHNEPPSPGWRMMLKGIRQAGREAKLKRGELAVHGGATQPWKDSREAGYELTKRALSKSPPTGIIYDSFSGTGGGLRAISEKGLTVPDDVSIVTLGVGNGDEEFTVPSMTTVDEKPREEVRLALECLMGGTAPVTRTLTVPPMLSERRSISSPPAKGTG